MSRIDTAPSATLLRFPSAGPGAVQADGMPSRRQIERAVARGRQLQGEAVKAGLRGLYRVLVGGCSLRSLRLPGEWPGGRQTCC